MPLRKDFVFLLVLQNVSVVLFQEKIHYENIMKNKVLPDIKEAEANYEELKNKRKVQIISNYIRIFQNAKCNFISYYITNKHRIYLSVSLNLF